MTPEELRFALAELPTMADVDQVNFVNELRTMRQHSIVLVALDSDVRGPNGQTVNCYEWALGLPWSQDYWREAALKPNAFVAGNMFEVLIPQMRAREGTPRDGDLVLYRSTSGFTHAGLSVGGERVRSKWSDKGCVWEHEHLEMPISYGTFNSCFEPPRRETVLEVFGRYRRSPRLALPEWFGPGKTDTV